MAHPPHGEKHSIDIVRPKVKIWPKSLAFLANKKRKSLPHVEPLPALRCRLNLAWCNAVRYSLLYPIACISVSTPPGACHISRGAWFEAENRPSICTVCLPALRPTEPTA